MAEWLYEDGIGEARAALVVDGEILQAEREWPGDGPRCGAVLRARFEADLAGARAALVQFDDGRDAWLQPVPAGFGPGQALMVEVVRERIGTAKASKDPKVRQVDPGASPQDGHTLRERIAGKGIAVRDLRAFGADLLEAAGWSELMEEAATGHVAFDGGRLWVEQTEAGVTIDVDGAIDPDRLAIAGAAAAARAIGRLGLGGSVLVDLPTVSNREVRARAAEAFDAAMVIPFERTAVNGFGLLQAVLPRRRASLLERIRSRPALAEALALYRRAEREPLPGAIEFVAAERVREHIGREANDAELQRRRGTPVRWIAPSPASLTGISDVRRVPVGPSGFTEEA